MFRSLRPLPSFGGAPAGWALDDGGRRAGCSFDFDLHPVRFLRPGASEPIPNPPRILVGSPDKGVHLQGGQDNLYVAWVFALELKLSKTLSGLVYSVPYLYAILWGAKPPL